MLAPLALLAATFAGRLLAADGGGGSVGGEVAGLKDQLDAGLKARKPEEFAFIAKVCTMVDLKQLPFDMVKSTFLWARKKRPYPYPYFERALRIRAEQRGIQL
jgi:hypothetical protein